MLVDQVQVDGIHAIDVFVALLFGQCVAKHFEHVVQLSSRIVQAAKGCKSLGSQVCIHGSVLSGVLYV